MKKTLILVLSGFFAAVCSCKDPFVPNVEAKYKNLLVTEGFIQIGGITTIQLSRTGDLKDWQSLIPEKNAEVVIEGDKGTILNGRSDVNGSCELATQNLSLTERYRLKIVTGGKTYLTGYLENKKSPEIDNINFRIENNGFRIYVNTHDNSNQTRYYNWNFTETWEIHSAFPSAFEYKNGQVVPRDQNINIEYCWASNNSSAILIGSSERLSEDKLTMVPINHVLGNSDKVAYMYSILVRQYGLTRDAYQYLENIKKNTEQIGTIFDALPSELGGNITCISDPEEQVIGWVSAGTTTQKRIFISYKDKPKTGVGIEWMYSRQCEPFTSSRDSLIYYLNARNLIISENRRPVDNGGIFINYTMGREDCIDCRLRGSNIKPAYWPD
ncbi:DUF4249 domain-containing protein [Pararcticibacter amylolyticus]|uniref:DUF4249 domain-containing protein n=1 Tax=Pararcticibacter amylolyticus TaxID=2173175 RepID=A0A2U2PIT7_9SPHI|nr:DUF4249 domain-containing protein [Pararcticibacter amylolyticus]PWG81317.1 DUF4249 domain-containing protein [Pararcticibacter amylolyticus]